MIPDIRSKIVRGVHTKPPARRTLRSTLGDFPDSIADSLFINWRGLHVLMK